MAETKTFQTEQNTMIFPIILLLKQDNLFSWVGHIKSVRLYVWGFMCQVLVNPIKK